MRTRGLGRPGLICLRVLVPILVYCHLAGLALAESGPSITELALAYDVRGYGEYTANPNGRVSPGEKVYIYLEVDGIASQVMRGQYQSRVSIDVEIVTPEGKAVFARKAAVVLNEQYESPQHEFWFYLWASVPKGLTAGRYMVNITARDLIADTYSQSGISIWLE